MSVLPTLAGSHQSKGAPCELSESGHNTNVSAIEFQFLVVGHNPDRAGDFVPHVNRDHQGFDHGEIEAIQILKSATRVREQLWRFAVQSRAARAEVPLGTVAYMLAE